MTGGGVVSEATPAPWEDPDFSCPDCGELMRPRDTGFPEPGKPVRLWACPAAHRVISQYRRGEERR